MDADADDIIEGEGTPEDELEALKARIADSVQDELEAGAEIGYARAVPALPHPPPLGGCVVPPARRSHAAAVQFVENGALVRYPVAIKVKRKIGARHNPMLEPGVQTFMEVLLETIDGGADEEWKEERRGDKIRKMMDKMKALNAPKEIEVYHTEWRTIIAKKGEIEEALEKARASIADIKALEESGERVFASPPPPADGYYPGTVIGGANYELGA